MFVTAAIAAAPSAALAVVYTVAENPGDWLSYLQSGGMLGICVLLAWALLKRKIVMGWSYDAMERERDYYRELAHKGTDLADRQTTLAEAMFDRLGVLGVRSDVLEARERSRTSRESRHDEPR